MSSTLLRQSGSLASINVFNVGSGSFRAKRTQLLAASWRVVRNGRSYATGPGPEKPKGFRTRKDGEGKGSGEDLKEGKGTKAAPGMEGLYDGKSALSRPSVKGKEKEGKDAVNKQESSSPPELPEGWVYMNAKEERRFKSMIEEMIGKNPASRETGRTLLRYADKFRKEGMPVELRDLLALDQDEPPSWANATKMFKFLRKIQKLESETRSKNEESEESKSDEEDTSSTADSTRQSPKGSNKNKQRKVKDADIRFDAPTFFATIFVSYMVYSLVVPGENSKDITYQEFRSMLLEKGLVERLTVEGGRVRVDVNREATQAKYPDSPAIHRNFHYYFSIGSIDSFERNLDAVQEELGVPTSERIPIQYSAAGANDKWSLLISFGPTLLLLGGLYFVSQGASKGAGGGASNIFGMMKSRAKQFNHETDIKVKFKDVAGMDEAKLEIMEFVSFLKTPERFERLGAKIPRGAILSGPPGTGKTLLAKATAGESSVPFFSVSGSEFVEMFVGVGASRVRDLFAIARRSTPCIIFIDEIDAIGKSRGKHNFGGNDEREATLNQILTEMDGFNTSEQVVVLAGTNRPDVLDKALMRPGRFDRHISIDRPTMDGRKQIFKVHLGNIVTNEEMDHLTGRLSALTPGFSGADIANCVNEAALIAARGNAKSVAMIHFEQAIERVVGGLEKKSLVLSSEERKTVAYHEAGHAVCGWFFEHADPLLKVSIIPRGQGALGYAQYLPSSDVYLLNVNQLMDRMAMTLGGRISEELHFPTVTSGASDDFNKVTRMATAMVTKWGMSKKLGPLHFEDDDNKLHKPFAEATAQMIDAEVSRIVHDAYKKCKDLLSEKKAQVGVVAEELLKKEMLDRNDMVRLLGPRQWESKEFDKYFGGGKSAPPPPPGEGEVYPPEGEGQSVVL